MIPDRFQYLLDDFWNFENLVKTWTHRPPNYYKNAAQNTRTIWGHPGKHYLWKSETHKSKKSKNGSHRYSFPLFNEIVNICFFNIIF